MDGVLVVFMRLRLLEKVVMRHVGLSILKLLRCVLPSGLSVIIILDQWIVTVAESWRCSYRPVLQYYLLTCLELARGDRWLWLESYWVVVLAIDVSVELRCQLWWQQVLCRVECRKQDVRFRTWKLPDWVAVAINWPLLFVRLGLFTIIRGLQDIRHFVWHH